MEPVSSSPAVRLRLLRQEYRTLSLEVCSRWEELRLRRENGQHGAAFLPGLPGLLVLARLLGVNVFWVGVLLPNLAAAAGMAVFARLAARLTGDRGTGLQETDIAYLLKQYPWFTREEIMEAIGKVGVRG